MIKVFSFINQPSKNGDLFLQNFVEVFMKYFRTFQTSSDNDVAIREGDPICRVQKFVIKISLQKIATNNKNFLGRQSKAKCPFLHNFGTPFSADVGLHLCSLLLLLKLLLLAEIMLNNQNPQFSNLYCKSVLSANLISLICIKSCAFLFKS